MNIKNLFKKKPLDLEKIYNDNKHFFELMLVKDFVGYIPKDVQEPALKIFKEYGEQFERWTLWQSWYVNRRAINDPVKIGFYNGMMVYLKVLNTLARVNKKNYQPERKPLPEANEVETSWIEEALKGVNSFNDYVEAQNNKKPETAENKGTAEAEGSVAKE